VLFKCHAGCTQDAVLQCLRDRALWPEPKSNGKANGTGPHTQNRRRVVAIYSYTGESGAESFQVVRYDPKDFRQRRSDGADGWIWNLNDVQAVPYHLPEVLEAIANEQFVFIVEGEKDVDALADLGVVATCNAGGAGKWKSQHAAYFKGIIPDNDEAGRKHALAVAHSLQGIAVHVHIVELPNLPAKGDASDWLTAGGTSDRLWALVALAPEGKQRARSNGHAPDGIAEPAATETKRPASQKPAGGGAIPY
jgi:hypothetical protein